jgi:hypothetical protein
MKRIKLQDMSVDQLVERFMEIGLAEDEALLDDEIARYNRLYDEMRDVEGELRVRGPKARLELLKLFDHPNAQVRLKAAIATLAVAPSAARRTLQTISNRQEYPQAADARGMIRALDNGTYKAT